MNNEIYELLIMQCFCYQLANYIVCSNTQYFSYSLMAQRKKSFQYSNLNLVDLTIA